MVKNMNIIKKAVLYITALSLCISAAGVSAFATEVPAGPAVSARSAVLMEKETGRILYEFNPHERLAPASVTKVMSLLLICEAIKQGKISRDDMVTASEHAASMGGSQIFLSVGEQMRVDDLLKSVVIASANDAVVALGEFIAGSEDAFVSLMNQRAQKLGMTDTVFKNASGLDAEGHLTSAYDIAVMSRALIQTYPEISEYATRWMDTVRDGKFGLTNTNRLIRSYNGITGLKTGSTSNAGCCLSATAERDGMALICAIMGAPDSKTRFAAATSLLDYGYANYALVSAQPSEPPAPVPVSLGRESSVAVKPGVSDKLLLNKADAAGIEISVTLCDKVEAPVAVGQKLGEITVLSNGTELERIPLIAAVAVERLGFFEIYGRLFKSLFTTKIGGNAENVSG